MEQAIVQLTAFERLWAWFETNRKRVAWCAGIVVVAGFGVAFFIWRQGEQDLAAGEALSQAFAGQAYRAANRGELVESYLKVAREHPGSNAAALALLQAGAGLFEEGKYAEAQAQFERFNREYPGHPFRAQAAFGIATCLDAQGKSNEAAAAYKDLADHHPGENVIPQAKFALARIYESQNKFEQARDLYEDIARVDAVSSIGSEAGMRLEELKLKYPNLAPVPAPAVAPAVSPGLLSVNTNKS